VGRQRRCAVRVGPRSAGARPGRPRTGSAGISRRITDRACGARPRLVGRHLGVTIPLAVPARLHGRAPRDTLGLDVGDRAPTGILAVANKRWHGRCGWSSVERGVHPVKPRSSLRRCRSASRLRGRDLLGIRRVPWPGDGRVLAALGAVIAGQRRDWPAPSCFRRSAAGPIAAALGPRSTGPASAMPDGCPARSPADCRFVGQSHSLTVAVGQAATPSPSPTHFRDLHTRRYGTPNPDAPIRSSRFGSASSVPGVLPANRYRGPVAIPSRVRPRRR